MSLPNKISDFELRLVNPDGSPKPGTAGFYYLQSALEKTAKISYANAIKFVLNDLVTRLRPIVEMQFEQLEDLPPLPEYANELSTLIECLTEYSKGISTQINNNNKTNFKTGSRALVLRAERLLKQPRGEFLNKLTANKVKITELRGRPAKNKSKSKNKIEEEIEDDDFDPTDELRNEIV